MATFTDDNEFLEIINAHLVECIVQATRKGNITSSVQGVFSLDELESKSENDIMQGKVAFGVAYIGCEPRTRDESDGRSLPMHTNGVDHVEFRFVVIIGCRADTTCSQRPLFQKILSMVRKEIFLSRLQVGRRAELVRPFTLVRERPEVQDSTQSVLYYSQVWSINLPLTSKLQGD